MRCGALVCTCTHNHNLNHTRVSIRFTDNYPLESPEVVFLPPAPIHPHIYSNGHICLDILYDGRNGGWSPALTISKVIISLRSMLASSTDKVRTVVASCAGRGHTPRPHRSDQWATTSMWRAWGTAPPRRQTGCLRTTTCDGGAPIGLRYDCSVIDVPPCNAALYLHTIWMDAPYEIARVIHEAMSLLRLHKKTAHSVYEPHMHTHKRSRWPPTTHTQ